jgi:flavin reductase (DIM6/NTAB) family NADH-FMN oxidoreductase RutF
LGEKISCEPGTVLAPVPSVMLTCVDLDGRPNIITLAWMGVVCSEPPMISAAIRPSRYSHGLVTKTGEFVINIPMANQLEAMDYCGIVSGKDVDKFMTTGLTAQVAEEVKAPLIKECPVNIECKVKQTIQLGSHDLFIAEVVRVHRPENEAEFLAAGIAYGNRRYYSLGDIIGTYGFARDRFSRKP